MIATSATFCVGITWAVEPRLMKVMMVVSAKKQVPPAKKLKVDAKSKSEQLKLAKDSVDSMH